MLAVIGRTTPKQEATLSASPTSCAGAAPAGPVDPGPGAADASSSPLSSFSSRAGAAPAGPAIAGPGAADVGQEQVQGIDVPQVVKADAGCSIGTQTELKDTIALVFDIFDDGGAECIADDYVPPFVPDPPHAASQQAAAPALITPGSIDSVKFPLASQHGEPSGGSEAADESFAGSMQHCNDAGVLADVQQVILPSSSSVPQVRLSDPVAPQPTDHAAQPSGAWCEPALAVNFHDANCSEIQFGSILRHWDEMPTAPRKVAVATDMAILGKLAQDVGLDFCAAPSVLLEHDVGELHCIPVAYSDVSTSSCDFVDAGIVVDHASDGSARIAQGQGADVTDRTWQDESHKGPRAWHHNLSGDALQLFNDTNVVQSASGCQAAALAEVTDRTWQVESLKAPRAWHHNLSGDALQLINDTYDVQSASGCQAAALVGVTDRTWLDFSHKGPRAWHHNLSGDALQLNNDTNGLGSDASVNNDAHAHAAAPTFHDRERTFQMCWRPLQAAMRSAHMPDELFPRLKGALRGAIRTHELHSIELDVSIRELFICDATLNILSFYASAFAAFPESYKQERASAFAVFLRSHTEHFPRC